MKWTEEEAAVCLKLYRAGVKDVEIGNTLNRSKRSVRQFIYRQREIDPDTWRAIKRSPPKMIVRGKTGKPNAQKCETCYYASGAVKRGWKCPWADRLEPVPGWTATAVEYKIHNTHASARIDMTWAIHDCPKYERG